MSEKKYICTEGNEILVNQIDTIEGWRNKAIEWIKFQEFDPDNTLLIVNAIKQLEEHKVLFNLSELWSVTFEEAENLVFSTQKYIEDCRSRGTNELHINAALVLWGNRCEGLTTEEMNNLGLYTDVDWMVVKNSNNNTTKRDII